MIFYFHLSILALLSIIVFFSTKRTPLQSVLFLILLFLFGFHCTFWGSSCVECNLSSPVCLWELALFWFVSILILYNYIRVKVIG